MVELVENEMNNFIKVWLSVFVSLTYCYTIGKITPKGFTRLVAILPIIFLFLVLPLYLTSIHLCGLTSFFISWLANFKLLLFAFGKPPLSFDPPLSFPYFLTVACLPIKVQNDPTLHNPPKSKSNTTNSSPQKPQNLQKKSPWNYIIKGTLLAIIVKIYDYSNEIPEKLLWTLYGFNIYFQLEIILALVAKTTKVLLGIELEPQFNEPLLATSLQDFWGRRWNLAVTNILRPTVYLPTLELSSKYVGQDIGKLFGIMSTFGVSAIYHEIIFYYLGRMRSTFKVTWFFLLHGLCLCVEMAVKKYFGRKKTVPRWLSGIATIGFVIVTGVWLFLPPLLGNELVTRGLQEYAIVGAFVRRLIHV